MARMRWLLTATIVVLGVVRFAPAREVDPTTGVQSTETANDTYVDRSWQRLLRGALYTFAERYDHGIAICDEVLKTDPNNARAYELRGWAYLLRKNHSRQAIADFSEALRRDPGNTAILITRGRAYQSDKEYDRAIADYTQAIHMDPRCAEAHAWRASSYSKKKVTNKAIAEYTAALKLDPSLLWARCDRGEAYRRRGEPERALADLEEVLKQEPYNQRALCCRCNVYLTNLGDYDRAITEASKCIENNPQDPSGYILRGMAYALKGEITKGLRDETTAARLNPQGVKFGYRNKSNSSIFYVSVGSGTRPEGFPGEDDSDERIEACTKRLGSDPNNVAIHYERACAYFRKHDYKRAMADLDEIIGRDPGDATAYFQRGFSHYKRKEYAEAIADCTKAIRIDPTYADYYFERARAYGVQGNSAKALRDCRRALLLDPHFAGVHVLRGWLYDDRKDYAAAVEEYSESIRLCPADSDAYERRACTYAHKEEYAKAIADYKKILQLHPQDRKAHCNLGWYLATCPDDKLRNGQEAGVHARAACEGSSWQEPRDLATLAAACAECGHFKEAVQWQTKALKLARESDKGPYHQRLELYQAHKPYRLSSPSASASSSD